MTGPITSIRRDEIPVNGVQFEFLWDATLLEKLPEQSSRPEIEAPLRLQVSFSLEGSRVILDGRCKAQGIITCVRCLERFSYPLNRSFRIVFQPVDIEGTAEKVQLGPGDMEVIYYDGEHIDLVAPVFEQIHLGLPAYPHCSPECKGLCPQCGANLNNGVCVCMADLRPQSPFAELAKLKKKA